MARAGPTDRCTLLATIRMKTQSEPLTRPMTMTTRIHSVTSHPDDGGTRDAPVGGGAPGAATAVGDGPPVAGPTLIVPTMAGSGRKSPIPVRRVNEP